jgi:hypothetical protein
MTALARLITRAPALGLGIPRRHGWLGVNLALDIAGL